MNRTYKGLRTISHKSSSRHIVDEKNKRRYCVVMVNDTILPSAVIDPSKDPKDDGKIYDWGYFGIYSYNLAFSILRDYFDNEPDFGKGFIIPDRIIMQFMIEEIVPLTDACWNFTDEYVTECLFKYLTETKEVEYEN